MKATLKFDLSDSDERKAHLRCILSTNMANVLWEINNNGHKKLMIEDNGKFNDGIYTAISHIRDLMEEYGININELID